MNINTKQKIILILIVIFIIISFFLVVELLKANKGNSIIKNTVTNSTIGNGKNNIILNEVTDSVEYDWNSDRTKGTDNKIKNVSSKIDYFTIKKLVINYINLIGNQNADELTNIISSKYISENNLTEDNIITNIFYNIPKFENQDQYYNVVIEDMLVVPINDIKEIYIVTANARINGSNEKNHIQMMFELDLERNTYYVYPEQYLKNKGYSNLKAEDYINFASEEINKAENKYTYEFNIKDQEIANEYFNNFRELLKYYPDIAYNKLNSEYSNKRFGSKESFNTYLEDNKMNLAIMTIDKYKVVPNDNYTDYICTDKYENMYIFRQQGGVMNYTVFLDNYTIMLNEDIEDYNKSDKDGKVLYNINKFINMVNTKDYNAIYNVLDSTFKSNNFASVENLKQYISTNMYDINEIEIEEHKDEIKEYYVFNCKITNKRNKTETKTMTIIINQSEGTDFTMSFSFN